jgi:hypothetical protein
MIIVGHDMQRNVTRLGGNNAMSGADAFHAA